MAKRSLRRSRTIANPLKGQAVSKAQVSRGFSKLERDWAREFSARVAHERRGHDLQTKFNRPLLDILAKDKGSTSAVAAMRKTKRVPAANQSSPVPLSIRSDVGRSQSALSMTLAAPFDHEYRWQSPEAPPKLDISTNKVAGMMSFKLKTDEAPAPSFYWGKAALGMSFQPWKSGLLQVVSDPIYTASASASSGGFGGLTRSEAYMDMWIDEHHPDGTVSRIIDGVTLLLGFTGANGHAFWQQISVPFKPPQPHLAGLATIVGVDPANTYILWVWCGGFVGGMGFTDTWTDLATSSMDVTIPNLRIDLY